MEATEHLEEGDETLVEQDHVAAGEQSLDGVPAQELDARGSQSVDGGEASSAGEGR